MEKTKIKKRLTEYLELHWPMYLCLSLFMTVSIVICIFAYGLIINKPERKDVSETAPIKVNVFITNNDTIIHTLSYGGNKEAKTSPVEVKKSTNDNDVIISSLSSEIKELRNMMQRMQEDTLCTTITKGKK